MKQFIKFTLHAYLLMIVGNSVNAQNADSTNKIYDLNSFQSRYKLYQRAGIRFDLNGKTRQERPFNNIPTGETNFQLDGLYDNMKSFNSDKKIGSLYQIFSLSTGYNKYPKENNGLVNLDYSRSNLKQIYNSNNANKFLIINHYSNARYFINHNKNNLNLNSYNSGIWLRRKLEIGKGTGRINYISTASSAWFLLKEIKAAGFDIAENKQNIEELGNALLQMYNTRVIDYRFRFRFQTATIFDYFKKKGMDISDPKLIAVIMDNYVNARNLYRLSGKTKSYGFSTTFGADGSFYRSIQLSTEDRNNSYLLSLPVSLWFDYSKQVAKNLYWNTGFSFRAEFSNGPVLNAFSYRHFNNGTLVNSFTKKIFDVISSDGNRLNLNVNKNWTYYPNTRNYLNITLGAEQGLHQTLQNSQNRSKLNKIQSNLSIYQSLNYYHWFSPLTQLYAGIEFRYADNRTRTENQSFILKSNDWWITAPFRAGLIINLY